MIETKQTLAETTADGLPRGRAEAASGAGIFRRCWQFFVRYQDIALPVSTTVALLILWEVWTVVAKTPSYLFPSPSKILLGIGSNWQVLLAQSLVTFREIIIGFFLSVVIGIPFAVALTTWRVFQKCVYPILVASQVVPKVAIAPIFIVLLGYGLLPKIIIAFIISFFPVVIASVIGFKSLELEKIYLAQSMGATGIQIFLKMRLPNALPNVLAGVKVASTLSVIGVLVGEFIGANEGIGKLILIANGTLDTVQVFAAVTSLTIMGFLMFFAVEGAERLLIPWHISRRIERLITS